MRSMEDVDTLEKSIVTLTIIDISIMRQALDTYDDMPKYMK
jgi:hypothetical protein